MDKKRIIVIAIAVIVVIMIIAGATAALLAEGNGYESKVTLGNRYLNEGNYDGAILAFQEAIALDESQESAYIGLYNTYVKMGNFSAARLTLESAVAKTNSLLLKDALNQMSTEQISAPVVEDEQVDAQQTVPEETKPFNYTLNEELLQFFSAANYNDYCSSYGVVSSTEVNGQYNIRMNNLPATLIYRDTSSVVIIDQTNGVPYNHYQPNEIQLDNVTVLFGGVDISYVTMKNLTGISNVSKDGNVITFTYQNCTVTLHCDDQEMITADSYNSIVLSVQSEAGLDKYVMQAKVVDATNGQGIRDAKVQVYAGFSTYGECVEGKTDSGGSVSLNLKESGTYTVVIEKDGYIRETFEAYVMSNAATTSVKFSLSPTMSGDTIRFVLSWGSTPYDLDSYLIGKGGDGSSVYISYRSMRSTNSAGDLLAELDVDDTDGYGPETITLYDSFGDYEFTVVDYNETGTMSMSGATVKIYVGDSLHTTVNVPSSLENAWSVCRISNGEIMVTNRAASVSSTASK